MHLACWVVALQEPEMSAMFDLEHVESCMGGRYPGLLFKLDEYRQRMQVIDRLV
jgi:hypothetical protein